MKYIFVTGGVVSGLGKGICAASLGRLLKQCGLRVKNQKFDPYLNVDPGTMSPYQHGEVFVTDDGAETDLDLGHYERFVDEALNANASVSSGKVYWSVLNRERQGGYLGGTVQIIPHVTDEIKSRVYAMDDGEVEQGLICVAAPVRDAGGHVIAAVSIAGPDYRMEQDMEMMIREIRQTAERISYSHGFFR